MTPYEVGREEKLAIVLTQCNCLKEGGRKKLAPGKGLLLAGIKGKGVIKSWEWVIRGKSEKNQAGYCQADRARQASGGCFESRSLALQTKGPVPPAALISL
jgi:hypothetical protein